MELLQTAYKEMHSLTPEQIEKVYQFILFQKLYEMSDTEYLSSIPGMMESIQENVSSYFLQQKRRPQHEKSIIHLIDAGVAVDLCWGGLGRGTHRQHNTENFG